MSNEVTGTFAALSRCIDQVVLAERKDSLHDGIAATAYRELWTARRLLEAARLVSEGADWDAELDGEPPRAVVQKHDLVLLEAAMLLASGERAGTPDGFPHAGAEVAASGVCDAGFCPCHDGQRLPQTSLLDRAA